MSSLQLLQYLVQEKVNKFKKEVAPYLLDEWVELTEPLDKFSEKKVLSVFVKQWGVGVVVQGEGVKLLERFLFEELTREPITDLYFLESELEDYLNSVKQVILGGK